MDILKLSFIVWIAFLPKAAAETRLLRLGLDQYCPYTCPEADAKGYAIEIVEQILSKHDYRIEYVTASWPRIKSMARKGSIDLLLPVNQSEVKELNILRTKKALNQFQGESPAAYFVHKSSNWKYTGPESLQSQVLGVIQGYTYPEPLRSHLSDPRFVSKKIVLASDQGNQRQIRMLASKRVTVIPSERIVFWSIAKQLGLMDEVKDAGDLDMPDELAFFYIGIVTRDHPEAAKIQSLLDHGFEALQASGTLKVILKKYGL